MNNHSISIQDRTEKFAIRCIIAYTEINKVNHFNDAAVVLSKQFLRSTTSIGANCSEAKYAQSRKDFLCELPNADLTVQRGLPTQKPAQ